MTTTDVPDTAQQLSEDLSITRATENGEQAPAASADVDGEHPQAEPGVEWSSSADYVVPLVHAHVAEHFVDAAFWASLGAAALVGALDLPVAGILAAGLFIVRRRHQR